MRAKCLEELLVYQKAVAADDEVVAYLKRPSFRGNRRLHEQLGASSERVGSLIAEGFGQDTDRHFASYLFRARGSSKETRNQLRAATTRGHITESERAKTSERYHEVERMLTSLADYLRRENRRRR